MFAQRIGQQHIFLLAPFAPYFRLVKGGKAGQEPCCNGLLGRDTGFLSVRDSVAGRVVLRLRVVI